MERIWIHKLQEPELNPLGPFQISNYYAHQIESLETLLQWVAQELEKEQALASIPSSPVKKQNPSPIRFEYKYVVTNATALRSAYDELCHYGFLKKEDTPYNEFKRLFTSQPLERKIEWRGDVRSLWYFFKLLKKEDLIVPKQFKRLLTSNFNTSPGIEITSVELANPSHPDRKVRYRIEQVVNLLKK